MRRQFNTRAAQRTRSCATHLPGVAVPRHRRGDPAPSPWNHLFGAIGHGACREFALHSVLEYYWVVDSDYLSHRLGRAAAAGHPLTIELTAG